MRIILIMIMITLMGSSMATCDNDTPPVIVAPAQKYQFGDVNDMVKPKPPKARKWAPSKKMNGGSIESAPTEDGRIPTPFDKDPRK